MNCFCTISDYYYLPMGISMIDSIRKHTKNEFVVYYLCLDDATFEKLTNLRLANITPVSLKHLIETYDDLKTYKSKEYREFVWMLSSYFSDYIMSLQEHIHVTYVDSDILFYDSVDLFYDEIGNKSVGIIKHRQIPDTAWSADGKYNVGVVYFKNDTIGRRCLSWWKDAVLHKKYPQLATCYDQKYLEGFLMMYTENEICVVDTTFAHSAPWHFRLFDWSSYHIDQTIKWQGKSQKLLFNHFSRFKYTDKGYTPTNGEYADHTLNFSVFKIPVIEQMYDDYFRMIQTTITNHTLQKDTQ